MAKKKTQTASDAVRDFMKEHPESGPQAIVDGLEQQGTEVSLHLARKIKYEEGGSGGVRKKKAASTKARRKAGRKKKAARKKAVTARTAATPAEEPSYSSLQEAKKLADQLGGVDKAKQALEALAKLQQ